MKYLLTLLLVSCSLFSAKHAPLPTVENVDIHKYLGTWYEIARFDQKFQKNCTAVTATYTLRKNGSVNVLNKCRKYNINGKLKKAKARAWITDKNTNAKLKVQFFLRFIKINAFAGNYWILALGDNYEYAMIGDPSRKYLWILSREKTLPEDTYNMLTSKAHELGFDITKLQMTPQ
ncbi:MAG: lipocalin family protein [Bacteriovoracaceae bacterium]|jgi:apolipoprotein D and lipocalin family protein|nr:lipocalin family protein [Bacteriovoracaceae bacterium]